MNPSESPLSSFKRTGNYIEVTLDDWVEYMIDGKTRRFNKLKFKKINGHWTIWAPNNTDQHLRDVPRFFVEWLARFERKEKLAKLLDKKRKSL